MIRVFTEWLRAGRPFVYARIGDGELSCMRNGAGCNADGVVYSPLLAEDLRAAYKYFGDHGAFIEKLPLGQLAADFARGWSVWRPIDLLIEYQKWEDYWGWSPWVEGSIVHSKDCVLAEVTQFWKHVRATPRANKVLVASPRVEGLQNDLCCAMWYVTLPNDAYEQVEGATQTIIDVCGERGLAILSCGPAAAKAIMHRVMQARPKATLIDAGSSFDALYGSHSRGNSLRNTTFEDLYA